MRKAKQVYFEPRVRFVSDEVASSMVYQGLIKEGKPFSVAGREYRNFVRIPQKEVK